ncbi:MAG: hypothetical protein U0R17_02160 [Acidimicrobiia bacterium]
MSPVNIPSIKKGILGSTTVKYCLSGGEISIRLGLLETTFEFTPYAANGSIQRLGKGDKKFPVYVARVKNNGQKCSSEIRWDKPGRNGYGVSARPSKEDDQILGRAIKELVPKIDSVVPEQLRDQARRTSGTFLSARVNENMGRDY